MSLPGLHSLFWKLAALLVTFTLLLISLSWFWSQRVELHTSYLSAPAKQQLQAYADAAEQAWLEGGAAGVDEFLQELREREVSEALLLDTELQALGSQTLTAQQRERLTFMRQLDWPMSRRSAELPYIDIPFANGEGHLVIQLPERFRPWEYRQPLLWLTRALLPAMLALLFCMGLYRVLIAPLVRLREQANALHCDDLSARAGAVARRHDELGELGRAFDHMAERLQGTVELQRQLLRDLSHELRTPLSRLRVAAEGGLQDQSLTQRVMHEVQLMQQLVGDTLELAWLDTERPRLVREQVDLAALWDMLCERVCFESGWTPERLVYAVAPGCHLSCNLNALARALENILRNAIRYSPEAGLIRLSGKAQAGEWHLWLEDQGPGVPEQQLAQIFLPFTRLNGARPGDGGFGLGLSIARSAIDGQGGRIYAENAHPGLRIHLHLPSA
jgi:two-component system sensor histidine kinase PfeS